MPSDTSTSPINTRRPKNRLTWHRLVSITAILLVSARIVVGAKNFTLGSNILDGIISVPLTLWVTICAWLESDPPLRLEGYLDTDWTPYFDFVARMLEGGSRMIIKAVPDEIKLDDLLWIALFASAVSMAFMAVPLLCLVMR